MHARWRARNADIVAQGNGAAASTATVTGDKVAGDAGGKDKKDGEPVPEPNSDLGAAAGGSGAEDGADGGDEKEEEDKDENADAGVGGRRAGKGRNGGAGSKPADAQDAPAARSTRTSKARS